MRFLNIHQYLKKKNNKSQSEKKADMTTFHVLSYLLAQLEIPSPENPTIH